MYNYTIEHTREAIQQLLRALAAIVRLVRRDTHIYEACQAALESTA